MSFEWTIKLFALGSSILIFVTGFSLWLYEHQIDQITKETEG